MTVDLFVSVLSFFANVVLSVGIFKSLLAVLGMVILGLLLKHLERFDRLLDRLERRWRRTPSWAKPTIYLAVFFLLGGVVWSAVPKTATSLALGLGLAVVWWVGGVRHVQRYELTDATPTAGWKHHIRSTRDGRKLTQASETASTKTGGRARKPTYTDDGLTFVAEPHDGQSAQEYAEEVNAGRHNAAIARRLGWERVKSTTATDLGDNTVEVRVSRDRPASDSDPLAEVHWWTPRSA